MKHLTVFIIFSLLGIGVAKAQYTDLVDLAGTNGANPQGSLTFSAGQFNGMTPYGGAISLGVIFSYDPVGNVYTDMINFTGSTGAYPFGLLTPSGSLLYGMANGGGANGFGVIFSYDPVANVYTDLVDLTDTNGAYPGAYPYGSLTLSGSIFYGMTEGGGANGEGVIFSFDPIGNVYTDLVNFTDTGGAHPGADPTGSLTLSGSLLYGMTAAGGANGYGVLFSYNPVGNVYTDLVNFTDTSGAHPGANPYGSLTLFGSALYGMTENGGANGVGVLFSYDPVGNVYRDLFNFANTSGSEPSGSLTLSGDVFYGAAASAGANGYGVVFSFADTTTTTGINNVSAGAGVKLFPNPNNGAFTIQSFTDQSSVAIYNLLGEKVLTQTLSPAPANNCINISAQPDGIYYYRILDEGGGLIDQGKIVVER